MNKEELKARTKAFSVRVFRFVLSLEQSKAVDVITS